MEEFGHEISDQLLLPPSSERRNEKQEARRVNQKCTIAGARAARDVYICSWPQPVPNDVMLNCLSAYYRATQ